MSESANVRRHRERSEIRQRGVEREEDDDEVVGPSPEEGVRSLFHLEEPEELKKSKEKSTSPSTAHIEGQVTEEGKFVLVGNSDMVLAIRGKMEKILMSLQAMEKRKISDVLTLQERVAMMEGESCKKDVRAVDVRVPGEETLESNEQLMMKTLKAGLTVREEELRQLQDLSENFLEVVQQMDLNTSKEGVMLAEIPLYLELFQARSQLQNVHSEEVLLERELETVKSEVQNNKNERKVLYSCVQDQELVIRLLLEENAKMQAKMQIDAKDAKDLRTDIGKLRTRAITLEGDTEQHQLQLDHANKKVQEQADIIQVSQHLLGGLPGGLGVS